MTPDACDYRNQIRGATRAVRFHSPTRFSWFGQLSPRLAPAVARALEPDGARGVLVEALADCLYREFYCRGFAVPSAAFDDLPSAADRAAFAEQLSTSNRGSGYWTDGWRVEKSRERSRLFLRRGALRIRVTPADVASVQGEITAGGIARLWMPKEMRSLSYGFYMALGDAGPAPAQRALRIYWSVTPRGALRLMREVTVGLNHRAVPFGLKVVSDPAQYGRCDSAVLYVGKEAWSSLVEFLARVGRDLTGVLRPFTPVFTKRLASGIALAEDPNLRESFGMHRCRLVAEGLIAARECDERSLERRVAAVERRFAEEGLDLDAPYLNAGSSDAYQAFFDAGGQPATGSRAASDLRGSEQIGVSGTNAFVEVAAAIGSRLARDALWHGDACTWLTPTLEGSGSGAATSSGAFQTLGPDLYGGTSGVGLFLAELYAATQDEVFRGAARGALLHALDRAAARADLSAGLYTGWPGVALAATRSASLLREERLREAAEGLLRRRLDDAPVGSEWDVLSGKAGAVLGLLLLRRVLGDETELARAAALGDELVEAAVEGDGGVSWRAERARDVHNLTGFAHGTAGIACVLLELFHATRGSSFLRAALRAFDYERHCYDPRARNWPDFRRERGRLRGVPRFVTAWCHGAPGIALSRLRACEILGDGPHRAEADMAVQTTLASVEASLRVGTDRWSLCHGLAGNADVLWEAARSQGAQTPSLEQVSRAVGQAGVRRFAGRDEPWPDGVCEASNPGLFLGLAGIGYFYLRLNDPSIPSVLLLRPGRE